VETLRQAKENNTPFTFWLLPRRIPLVFGEKMRESEAAIRLSASGFRKRSILRVLLLRKPEAE
jgi:hypothetical protein